MPEHYTKNTVEVSLFCSKCMKHTRWRVADGRRQWCIPCYERDHQHKQDEPQLPPPAEQGNLF